MRWQYMVAVAACVDGCMPDVTGFKAAAVTAADVVVAGAYYVEKRYVEAADAYGKSLAIFEMIDDVSAPQREWG